MEKKYIELPEDLFAGMDLGDEEPGKTRKSRSTVSSKTVRPAVPVKVSGSSKSDIKTESGMKEDLDIPSAKKSSSAASIKKRKPSYKKTAKKRKKKGLKKSGFNIKMIPEILIANLRLVIIIVAAIALIIVFSVIFRSCNSSFKSPVKVVQTLIDSYSKGKLSKAKKCFLSENDGKVGEDVVTEVETAINYFNAHNASEVKKTGWGTLMDTGEYAYVYITYSFVLEDGQEYPAISTYMTKKVDKKYYILPSSKITDELSNKATTAYTKFMTSDTYQNYLKAYDAFIAKNPEYEEQIAKQIE